MEDPRMKARNSIGSLTATARIEPRRSRGRTTWPDKIAMAADPAHHGLRTAAGTASHQAPRPGGMKKAALRLEEAESLRRPAASRWRRRSTKEFSADLLELDLQAFEICDALGLHPPPWQPERASSQSSRSGKIGQRAYLVWRSG